MQGSVMYHIPSSNLSWSSIFRQMESNKERLGIIDYSVSQTTLEQVWYYSKYKYATIVLHFFTTLAYYSEQSPSSPEPGTCRWCSKLDPAAALADVTCAAMFSAHARVEHITHALVWWTRWRCIWTCIHKYSDFLVVLISVELVLARHNYGNKKPEMELLKWGHTDKQDAVISGSCTCACWGLMLVLYNTSNFLESELHVRVSPHSDNDSGFSPRGAVGNNVYNYKNRYQLLLL